jgi:gliding motility-associated-like protein
MRNILAVLYCLFISNFIYSQTSADAAKACKTWTFQLQYSNANVDERPSDVLPLPGSGYIICGSDSSANGVRGRLLKLNSEGAVVLSKELAVANKKLEIKRIRLFSNGKLYAVGNATDPLSGANTPILVTLDTVSLSVLSVFELNGPAGAGPWQVADLNEGRENTCFILSSTNSLINVTKLTYTTNSINWSKTYGARNSPRPVGINLSYSYVYAAWNETDGSNKKGVVMALDFDNGNYKYGNRTGGSSEGDQVELQSLTMNHSRPVLMASIFKNSQYAIARLNYEFNTIVNYKEVFAIEGVIPVTPAAQQNSQNTMIATLSANEPGQVYLTSTFPDNYNSPIRSWKLDYGMPASLLGLALTEDGGSLSLSQSTTIPRRIVLIKTDSVATLAGCGSVEVKSRFERQLQPSVTDVLPLSPETLKLTPMGVTVNDLSVLVTENCKSLYCPVVPNSDTCLQTFFKEYRNYTNSLGVRGLLKLDNGKMLIHSAGRDNPYVAIDKPYLAIIDTLGRLQKTRLLNGPDNLWLTKIIRLQDGHLLGVGAINFGYDNSEIYLIKFDTELNMLWQKKLSSTPGFNGVRTIFQSSEGDLFLYLADKGLNDFEERVILKMTADGNPIWMQKYNVGASNFWGPGEHTGSMVELGGSLVLKFNLEHGDFSPYLLSIQKSDGAVQWVRKYQMPGPFSGSNVYSLSSLLSDGNNIFMLGWSQNKNIFLKIAPDGTVIHAKRSDPDVVNYSAMYLTTQGKLLVSANKFQLPSYVNGIVEMDTSFQVGRTQYMQIPRYGYSTTLLPFDDTVTYSLGGISFDDIYQGSLYFQKYNFNSSFATCTVSDLPVKMDSYIQSSSVATVSQKSAPVPVVSTYGASFSDDHIAYSGFYCGSSSTCTSVDLQGPTVICDSTMTYHFPVLKNAGCTGKVVWQLDTAANQVHIVSISNTELRLKVKSGGAFTLHAKVFGSCQWLEDSVTVSATINASKLDLGADRSLCKGNSIRLKAGPGFSSYRWQDGSTDSIYTVNQPGLYHVEVLSCGNILRDTVKVDLAPPIPFTIAPDRFKCNNDTLRLTAPDGFLNYTWSNNYNISSLTAREVIVNPMEDTAYYIAAEKTPGCFAYDTVRIKVFHSPAIRLGKDTSFCEGSQVVLNAGSGFAHYMWNTGAVSASVTIKDKGSYSVIGTTAEGCRSFDTLQVVQVFANPVVHLDQNKTLCTGETKTLDPGSFTGYQWQDGSVGRTLTVDKVGTYYVQVTDQNGCHGSDTTQVTRLLPLPAGFLPVDTAICTYGTLELKPLHAYKQYHWNTGQTTSTLSVNRAGLYWLEVRDENNCSGRDSIIVNLKDCLQGLYVPSAFTPDGDSKNDVFRAMLFGKVKHFEFAVYNRWGAVVFKTTEQAKGWDGYVNGRSQDSGVFIWTCTYQLEGHEKQQQKGTVMLIK